MKDFEFIQGLSIDNLKNKDSQELLDLIKSMEEINDDGFYAISKILSSRNFICEEFPSIKENNDKKNNREVINSYLSIRANCEKDRDVFEYIAILQIIKERGMDPKFFEEDNIPSNDYIEESFKNFYSFVSKAKELINEGSKNLINKKPNEQPISEYKYGLEKVCIFKDRVEIGNLILKSYEIGEIKSVKIGGPSFAKTMRLNLANNSQSPWVSISNKSAVLCKNEIENLIKDYSLKVNNPTIKLECDVLGGFGTDFIKGYKCYITFRDKYVHFESPIHKITLSMKIADLTELKIGGDGKKEKVYGGIGGVGDSGAVIALPIKSSTINTTVKFGWYNGALFLNTSEYTPENLSIILSPITSEIEKLKMVASSKANSDYNKRTTDEKHAQLEKLKKFLDDGTLTSEEFVIEKKKILDS